MSKTVLNTRVFLNLRFRPQPPWAHRLLGCESRPRYSSEAHTKRICVGGRGAAADHFLWRHFGQWSSIWVSKGRMFLSILRWKCSGQPECLLSEGGLPAGNLQNSHLLLPHVTCLLPEGLQIRLPLLKKKSPPVSCGRGSAIALPLGDGCLSGGRMGRGRCAEVRTAVPAAGGHHPTICSPGCTSSQHTYG